MEHAHQKYRRNTLLKQTVLAIIVSLVIFIGHMLHTIPEPSTTPGYWVNWISAIMTLIVLVYSGWHFFNTDVLIFISAGLCWLYSVFILIFMHHLPSQEQHVYFEFVVAIIALVNLLELLKPYNINNYKLNDLLLQRIINKIISIIIPTIIAAAICTAIVWYYISKQPIATNMLFTTVSVLIIACPYALKFIVSIAAITGINKAKKCGILIRNISALQAAYKINTVILCKTGIITLGKPQINEIITTENYDTNQVLSIAASLELNCKHPYGLAIIATAKQKQLLIEPVINCKNFDGLGISGIVAGQPACIGNKAFMEAQLIKIDLLKDASEKSAKNGATVIYVARNKQLIGMLTLIDPIKNEAKFIVQKLHDMQMRVILLTGDQQLTAHHIAAQIGITEVIANVMPTEKSNQVATLQQEDAIVAIVGEQINDAPALIQASLSFTFSTAADAATQVADVIITNESLDNIIKTIYICKQVINNIKQNLFVIFVYNIVAMPIAAGIFFPFTGMLLTPTYAATAMTLFSLAVMSNAQRLQFMPSTPYLNFQS